MQSWSRWGCQAGRVAGSRDATNPLPTFASRRVRLRMLEPRDAARMVVDRAVAIKFGNVSPVYSPALHGTGGEPGHDLALCKYRQQQHGKGHNQGCRGERTPAQL